MLKFVGEFARWEAGAQPSLRSAARGLLKAAYPGNIPYLFDPFSGYGAIPGEAARVGCESFASDLNPVAVLCLRTLLEGVPRHREKLIAKFREGAEFIKREVEKRLTEYYTKHNGKHPIAWLWARIVTCEGPRCGATIPLISQTIIAKGGKKTWIEVTGDQRTKEIQIAVRSGKSIPSELVKTSGGGHAVCPVCGFATNRDRIKAQGREGNIGNRLYGVAMAVGARQGKEYLNATAQDKAAYDKAVKTWRRIVQDNSGAEITEKYPYHDPRAFTAGLYGIKTWGDLFSPRQKLALYTIGETLRDYENKLKTDGVEDSLVRDTITALALGISNLIHYSTNMSTWLSEGMISCFIAGNAIAMRWDWAEANPLVDGYVGGLDFAFRKAEDALAVTIAVDNKTSTVMQADAANVPLPDDAADMFFTDPPYYDVVPYADLSDLSYVWLKRFIGHDHPDLFSRKLTPKAEQIVVNPYAVKDGRGDQSSMRYQERMTQAFSEGRRVLKPSGIGCIVFAHKGTAAWESLLASIINSGFIVTASWPIDTEREARMRANKSAVLGSSVHIVVRPRESLDGSVRRDDIGDWRDVLVELPKRTHDWMPRLASEGIVGADAIFACLGPALEIFSRYSRVEKASGEQVTLREYLEHVWAAVAKEALNMIFEGADATGFDEDARLTATWLWTLSTGNNGNGKSKSSNDDEETDDKDESEKAKQAIGRYALEYDAARKIAQGLGAHLEKLSTVVEVKGDTAHLLPVSERTRYLFGKDETQSPSSKRKKKEPQLKLGFVKEIEEIETKDGWGAKSSPRAGSTVLDRLHQSMILFAAGRSEALKRFLVEEGAGNDQRFWRLAQALSALYPKSSDEKRWVDGVLARKKGLGF